jgi:hypothetical protein
MVTVSVLSLLSILQWLASMTDMLWANEIACFSNAVFLSLFAIKLTESIIHVEQQ